MVSRVELFLILVIVFFATRGVLTQLSRETIPRSDKEKILELFSLHYQEVNQTALLDRLTARYMVQYPHEIRYEHFMLYTPNLILQSSHATQKQETIFLEQNATIIKADGSRYMAGRALYDKNKQRLELSKDFFLTNRYGDLRGKQMQYDAGQKEIRAKAIKALYEMQ